MHKVSGLNAQWFSTVLGTLSLSLALYVLSFVFGIGLLFSLGKVVFIAAIALFWFVFIMWIYRYTSNPLNLKNDFSSPDAISFTALLGVIFYACAFFYIAYFSPGKTVVEIILYLYFIVYFFILLLNILLNYMVYSGKVRLEKVSYANIIPSIVMGAGIILTSVLITGGYFSGNTEILTTIYFTTLMGFGISVLQFIFYGVSAFVSFMESKKDDRYMPTTMLPLGAISMIVINILFLPLFNSLGIFYLPESDAALISVTLWGVEILYFMVGSSVLFSGLKKKRSLSVWAFVFPVGISIFSDYLIWYTIGYNFFAAVIVLFSLILVVYYIYALSVTIGNIRVRKRSKTLAR